MEQRRKIKILPPRFIFGFLIICGVIFVGILLLFSRNREKSVRISRVKTNVAALAEQSTQNFQKDSDADDLPDWLEQFYGTDPTIADTDGDGFKDGEEIKNGYDPTQKGDRKLSEKFSEEQISLLESAVDTTNSVNLTELFSNTIWQNIVEQNQGGLIKDPTTGEDAITLSNPDKLAQVLEPLLSQKENDFKELLDNVRIDSENSEAKIQNYKNKVKEIINENLIESSNKASSLENQNIAVLNTQIIPAYEKTIEALLELKVPSSFLTTHKQLIKIFSSQKILLGYMTETDRDPIKALYSAQFFLAYRPELEALLSQINS